MKKTISIIAILLMGTTLLSSCGQKVAYAPDEIESYTQCLTDNGVKLYGAFWCANCAKQKKLLGGSYGNIAYIECDPRCEKDEKGELPGYCLGNEGQPELCMQKKVAKYPHWEFSDGSVMEGVKSLETLGEKAGCSAPQKL